MALTGVSVVNIGETTGNTALVIPKETGDKLLPKCDQKKTQISVSLSEMKLTIIYEISMISSITLLEILQRLDYTFGVITHLMLFTSGQKIVL